MKFNSLKIFNSEDIGRIFTPDGFAYENCKTFIPSIIHGRSIAMYVSDYEWILIKGGGWNYGGPSVYISKKDDELVFGLNPSDAGKREYEVSKAIEKISDDFPKVLYYKKFLDYTLPTEYDFLKAIRYSNGRLVDPCLTYTKVKCPYRVLDLAYQTDNDKHDIISECCKYWKVDTSKYIEKFAYILGEHVAVLHKNGFINDTLEYSNVTLLAEIVDYELVTAPDVPFHRNIDGTIIPNERREKEILYGAEVTLQLSTLLHKQLSLYETYDLFLVGYKSINPKFVQDNFSINEIVERRKFIL